MYPGDSPAPSYLFDAAVDPFLFVRKTATGVAVADDPLYAGTARLIMGATTEAGGAANKRGAVLMCGTTKVVAGATLTPGTHRELTTDASGRAVPRTDASTQALCAIFVGENTYTVGQEAPVRLVEAR